MLTGQAQPEPAASITEMLAYAQKRDALEARRAGPMLQARPTDVFIVTPAKCGTTWMQQIVHGLRTRGSMDFEEITQVVPWLEMAASLGIDLQAPQVSPLRAFKTHQPLTEVPRGGKYILIVRDPNDALLSHYHFYSGWVFKPGTVSVEDFARKFYMPRRAYWRFVRAFWEQRRRADVLTLSFEQMKQDLPGTVTRVADFMDVELDSALQELVVRQSEIEFMRAHRSQFDDHLVRQARFQHLGLPSSTETAKVRNGLVGESRTGLPEAIHQEMAEIWSAEITATLGLPSYDHLRQELAA